ncbi:L-ribulose-5-phosphate 3-epimerase [Lentilactobacillus kisonensis]|uniref:L-ribulose-5-phosphate 3-epimerase n=1 Tax=Lentilactobacillus kisonensis DSM 19906 = JCM 15041 TaxID=1423766 RepID=A0A0R1NF06_9LACO|nr:MULTISPECIES: L-ribulose-5-phosphate 3-epimerase [Lentilactobacillus]KRL18880.1 L-xylulose 5-phosphate 3-epimerase [Lentilactobacillus kisonensis DSM 19906 = JCM 15041]MCT3558226.1 L-ribulose-5-phosphate 3-epimerase [Lentilactobacillus buchneri]
MNSLGIYEKALPKHKSWLETLEIAKELGFNFIEFSVDESDERLARLDWTKKQREEVRDASWKTGIRLHTLMLSGHRRFPLGSSDPDIREKSLEMLSKAVDLASDLGIRNIQLAGYDVYYEPKTIQSREWFMEGLKKAVEIAARKEIMLDIETMDDPFINSLNTIAEIKTQIHSPWLQAYPDLGNLTAWPQNDVGRELESNIDNIAAVHLKDTTPVSKTSKGQFRDVPFGKGTVDFEGCLRTLKRLDYNGAYTIEMWSENSADPLEKVKVAKQFFDDIFEKVGIKQEPAVK